MANSTNDVNLKDVYNQAKSSVLAVGALIPTVTEGSSKVLTDTIGIVADTMKVARNVSKRVVTDSNAMQALHELKPALIAKKEFRKISRLMQAISMMERVLDGNELSDEEYTLLDSIQSELN